MKNKVIIAMLVLLANNALLEAQGSDTYSGKSDGYELTGKLNFDIASPTGQVLCVAITVGDGGTGPYEAIMCGDPTLPTHTVYRPSDLSVFTADTKLPIVLWANGGCRNSSGEFRNFLSEIASHGFLILAIGPVSNTLMGGSEAATGGTEADLLLQAIDWAVAENSRPESEYFQKVATNQIAVMGQSCGGLQALSVSADPRISTSVIWNSGLFELTPEMLEQIAKLMEDNKDNEDSSTPRMNMPTMQKSELKNLHAPIAYFNGGELDIATRNSMDDYQWIDQVPVLLASYDFSDKVKETGNQYLGHYPATYRDANGGDFAVAGVAWLKWQLKGDAEAGKMFSGENPRLLNNRHWSINKKNFE